jgi:hypothetical protein
MDPELRHGARFLAMSILGRVLHERTWAMHVKVVQPDGRSETTTGRLIT